MSRGRRAIRLKPIVVDGWKFAGPTEARQYEGLKAYAGSNLRLTVSTDGRLLVCEWGDGISAPQRTQAFALAGKKKQKFNTRPVTVDGVKFGSLDELKRFTQLLQMQKAGVITDLKPHPRKYEFIVNGVHIGSYTPDSEYRIVDGGEMVTEDVKSDATRLARDFPLRKKLMLACHGIVVKEFIVNTRPAKRRSARV